MDSLIHDSRVGIRSLAKAPGVTAAAVLALALSITPQSAAVPAQRHLNLMSPLQAD